MIYVIGVDHFKEQMPHAMNDMGRVSHLQTFVRRFCREKDIQLIAEEWCEDARIKLSIKNTYPEALASELKIKHCPCDPGLAAREAMGFKDRGQIALEIGVPFPYTEDTPEERANAEKINVAARKFDEQREEYWLEEIIKNNGTDKNTLLVCGYGHADNFVAIAKKKGYEAVRVPIQ